jgi:hypothetical protein
VTTVKKKVPPGVLALRYSMMIQVSNFWNLYFSQLSSSEKYKREDGRE